MLFFRALEVPVQAELVRESAALNGWDARFRVRAAAVGDEARERSPRPVADAPDPSRENQGCARQRS